MKKKTEKKINLLLSLLIVIVLLPLLLTIVLQRMELESILAGNLGGMAGAVGYGTGIGTKADSGVEDAVMGIVAKEISANAQQQAILAQSVIARTNLYDAKKSGTAEPESLDWKEMQELWGENFDKTYKRIQECVRATEDEVLIWEGSYIYAAYHAVSAGMTRNMDELYKDVDMPYLKSADCIQDTAAKNYLSVCYLDVTEFLEKCGELCQEGAPEDVSQIQVMERDMAGYVLKIQIGENSFDGEKFREKFGLNSSCFTVTEEDGQVRIVTKGMGHGLGLSQYTANQLAKEGMTYQQILEYFYNDAEIQKIR